MSSFSAGWSASAPLRVTVQCRVPVVLDALPDRVAAQQTRQRECSPERLPAQSPAFDASRMRRASVHDAPVQTSLTKCLGCDFDKGSLPLQVSAAGTMVRRWSAWHQWRRPIGIPQRCVFICPEESGRAFDGWRRTNWMRSKDPVERLILQVIAKTPANSATNSGFHSSSGPRSKIDRCLALQNLTPGSSNPRSAIEYIQTPPRCHGPIDVIEEQVPYLRPCVLRQVFSVSAEPRNLLVALCLRETVRPVVHPRDVITRRARPMGRPVVGRSPWRRDRGWSL